MDEARSLFVGWLEMLECIDTLPYLAEQIEAEFGKESRDSIFQKEMPPLGTDEMDRWKYTSCLLTNMSNQIPVEDSSGSGSRCSTASDLRIGSKTITSKKKNSAMRWRY